ncbi:MAG: hypothetical protein MJ226_01930 [archaeon]|uniref:Uncharacterized protein n=1 Tax=Methanobrevibacter gottschalkii DSM 11977 TaxID=1122229 RepID=A0A3N5B625_9EURY|nr:MULTISPECIES: hypothetical protein [Methanobrevibacter]MCQ2970319.1 hypothetical protein [archaeon]OEC95275.1 hypothetical protein A9505_07770 [Methanobrevibacter sp. A27]RPF53126.1 hypothetical protein EDC42_0701 [Methanobrevibacter gottschalkii DSM 11977]
MNKKEIIIILIFIGFCFVFAGPVFAKEKVKVNVSIDDHPLNNKGFIVIKLVDSRGKDIESNGTIHYKITDEFGNYKWAYKSYDGEIRLKYTAGIYKVDVKFDGDFHYNSAIKNKSVIVKTEKFNPYTYYDNHNWGLNQEIDDYIEYNYWDEDIYDDPTNYDGEGP